MNRVWSKVGKILGGLFLCSGGTVTFGILVGMAMGHPTGWLFGFLSTLLVFFGLLPASLGGWFLYTGHQAHQRSLREQFFRMLQANQGRLCVLDFATATQLEPTIAREHLDNWAREFSAHFEVTDAGEIYYLFTPQTAALPEDRMIYNFKQLVRRVVESI